jgi:hypothetical protein
VSKKTGKPIKLRKPEKKIKKTEPKKNPIKPINFLKKPAGEEHLFGFGFINKKPKKPNRTKPKLTKNRKKTEPKLSQTEPNWFEPVFALKNQTNRTETGRFDLVSVFFFKKKIPVWLLFLIKTEPNRK